MGSVQIIDPHAEESDVTAVIIDPLERNTAARPIYERLGFSAVGPRRFGTDDCTYPGQMRRMSGSGFTASDSPPLRQYSKCRWTAPGEPVSPMSAMTSPALTR